jgi:hypothetical protein
MFFATEPTTLSSRISEYVSVDILPVAESQSFILYVRLV